MQRVAWSTMRAYGVTVRSIDLNRSGAGACLELQPGIDPPAVRLGLAAVRSIGTGLAEQIVTARDTHGPYTSLTDLTGRLTLSTAHVKALATAGAFDSLGLSRRGALWGAAVAVQRRPEHLNVIPERGRHRPCRR